MFELIDLQRYPVDRLESAAGSALTRNIQRDLEQSGAASLPGFLKPDAVRALADEAERLAPLAYSGPTEVSPYFFNYDLAGALVPDGHPTRFKGKRNLAQVAYDLIPGDGLLCPLYESDIVTRLVAHVEGKSGLCRLADRYQSLNISVMESGGCQQWHFDRGQLVTTMLLQAAQAGGEFEYVPNLRSDADEHFEDVAKVLAGDRSRVQQLAIEPGTLNFFRGHYSMHRVTEVLGTRRRLQSIFAFSDAPDTHGNVKSSVLHYGQRVAALEGYSA
ncbi:MAG: hypothetical protein ACI8PT_001391 [Gammaproteobacteria bacterium]|jgi:hypothetical protein